mmetsp:Transcript_18722/g.43340  ORF Transcript_18722/g.43340 Transcript_18722/m.43340 type:complete len:137 (+) Transcript_18722:1187-1597(+)
MKFLPKISTGSAFAILFAFLSLRRRKNPPQRSVSLENENKNDIKIDLHRSRSWRTKAKHVAIKSENEQLNDPSSSFYLHEQLQKVAAPSAIILHQSNQTRRIDAIVPKRRRLENLTQWPKGCRQPCRILSSQKAPP